MPLNISVVICTHNPNENYLARTINALRTQTLSPQTWELILVDNASKVNVSEMVDTSWHPNYRCIREESLGLTHARIRGISESRGNLIVFVDDDNVLYSDYLEKTLELAHNRPYIGAWAGQAIGEFEAEPSDKIRPYLGHLAVREFERESWACLLRCNESTPNGAGLCIRASIGHDYISRATNNQLRLILDRKGTSLYSCGDQDIALTACDLGYATGQFPHLRLIHIIPKRRLEYPYILSLIRSAEASSVILEYIWQRSKPEQPTRNILRQIARRIRERNLDPFDKQILQAREQGRLEGAKVVYDMSHDNNSAKTRSCD